jgi:hypothetical protein
MGTQQRRMGRSYRGGTVTSGTKQAMYERNGQLALGKCVVAPQGKRSRHARGLPCRCGLTHHLGHEH